MMIRKRVISVAIVLTIAFASDLVGAQQISDSIEWTTVNIDIDANNREEETNNYTINLMDCRELTADYEQTIEIEWEFFNFPPDDAMYTIKRKEYSSMTCADSSFLAEETDECVTLLENQPLDSNPLTYRLSWAELTGLTDVEECETAGNQLDLLLIFTSLSDDASADDTDLEEVRFDFWTGRPQAPDTVEVEAGESTLSVSWSEVGDANNYTVYASTAVLSEGDSPETLSESGDNTSLTNIILDDGILINNTYYVSVIATDIVGNNSLLSDVVVVNTQPVTDFYELYRGEGGGDEGGYCTAADFTSPSLWSVCAIGAALFMTRRRRTANSR